MIAAVRVVEDDPACNARTGAVLTSRGTLELDACVMDGASLASGSVAVLPPFRHPIEIARAVLEDGRYHLLVGDGAAAFARARGFEPEDVAALDIDESWVLKVCSDDSSGGGFGVYVHQAETRSRGRASCSRAPTWSSRSTATASRTGASTSASRRSARRDCSARPSG